VDITAHKVVVLVQLLIQMDTPVIQTPNVTLETAKIMFAVNTGRPAVHLALNALLWEATMNAVQVVFIAL
jgi:hypothetical protein